MVGRALLILLCLVARLAAAPVALEPYDAAGKLTVALPKGWVVTADLAKGAIAAQQDPKRVDAASVLLILQTGVTAGEDQLLDAVMASIANDLKVVKRASLPDNRGRLLVSRGTVSGVVVRIGAVAVVADGSAVIGVLAAKEADFEPLGGTQLVLSIISSMRASGAPPPPAPTGTAVALKSVALADLVGEWGETGGSTIDWVDTSTGQYRGSTAAFFGASHAIAADGTFKYLFVGRTANHTVREGDSGTVGFKDGFLVISYKNRKTDAVRTLRVMGYVTVADGTTFMALVNAITTQKEVHWDDPAYVANFCGGVVAGVPTHCVGGETWVRRPRPR